MGLIDIHIRYSKDNVVLDKVTTLNMEKGLIYKDESLDFKTIEKTFLKFSILTLTSPLFSIARLVRSVAFVFSKDFNRAGKEFIGGLAYPLVASYCLIGSLLSGVVYIISNKSISFHVQMRRTYAYFEAWVNNINLQSLNLVSYSKRVSDPFDCVGDSTGPHKHVWTTAPCMQPILEKGYSNRGGLLDAARLQKLFPLMKINNVHREHGHIVIQSEYSDKHEHYTACNGAYEHSRHSFTCCCCWRIETVYNRFLCFEAGHGNCSSIANSGNSSGIAFCKTCGVMGCCCYETENNELVDFDVNVVC